jgi:hypothetical protein
VARLYLLGTNILSHLVRQPQRRVAERIADVGEVKVFTSVIVACELRYGAAKRGSRRLMHQVEAVLGVLTIIESSVDRVHAAIRVALGLYSFSLHSGRSGASRMRRRQRATAVRRQWAGTALLWASSHPDPTVFPVQIPG